MKLALLIVVLVLIATACARPKETVEDPTQVAMKSVSYRGGLVSFSIPSHWKEEYVEDGGGMFYEDSGNSGTLRLNVLTFTGANPDFNVDVEAKKSAAKYGGEAVALRDGEAMVRYDSQTMEDGEAITLRYWQVYNRVSDSYIRIAVFSYSAPFADFWMAKHVRTMDMLDREIRNARFSKELGTIQ